MALGFVWFCWVKSSMKGALLTDYTSCPISVRGRTAEASTGIFRRVPLTRGAPQVPILLLPYFKTGQVWEVKYHQDVLSWLDWHHLCNLGFKVIFFARFFLEKNPDVDFFSGAAYWPRKWFESSMKGQDPDCWQLEAELSPLVFVCVFSSGLRGGKNELLKLYGWKSLFSSHIVEFGWCSFWCVLYVPKILRKLRALVVFFADDCKSNGADTCVWTSKARPWDFLEKVRWKKNKNPWRGGRLRNVLHGIDFDECWRKLLPLDQLYK